MKVIATNTTTGHLSTHTPGYEFNGRRINAAYLAPGASLVEVDVEFRGETRTVLATYLPEDTKGHRALVAQPGQFVATIGRGKAKYPCSPWLAIGTAKGRPATVRTQTTARNRTAMVTGWGEAKTNEHSNARTV